MQVSICQYLGTNLYTQIIVDASAAGQLVIFVSERRVCYIVISSVFVINPYSHASLQNLNLNMSTSVENGLQKQTPNRIFIGLDVKRASMH